MRRIAAALFVCALLLPADGPAQDYQAGLDAAGKGDFAAAVEEWRPLAEKGDARAQYQLGLLYRHGKGVERDYGEAAGWFRKSAERGLADSQFHLGELYVTGKGVKKDLSKAFEWFEKAAEQGSAPAMTNLAYMYRYGKGVKKSIGRALIRYRDAASQGYAPALDNLGMVYASGQIVQRDYVEAYKWLTLATSFGSARSARTLRYVTNKMTADQLTQGDKRIHDWVVEFQKRQGK